MSFIFFWQEFQASGTGVNLTAGVGDSVATGIAGKIAAAALLSAGIGQANVEGLAVSLAVGYAARPGVADASGSGLAGSFSLNPFVPDPLRTLTPRAGDRAVRPEAGARLIVPIKR